MQIMLFHCRKKLKEEVKHLSAEVDQHGEKMHIS